MGTKQREHVIDAVMAELQGFLDAVTAFETMLTGHFGIDRADLRWFTALAEAEDGMSPAEIAGAAGLSVDEVNAGLERLSRAGQLERVSERVALNPAARTLFVDTYARIETAYVGLHRYGAEELGVIRTFLRVGRHFYERQLKRFERAVGRQT